MRSPLRRRRRPERAGQHGPGQLHARSDRGREPASLGNLNPATTDITSPTRQPDHRVSRSRSSSDPASAFQLLLGKDVPLITYETPLLNLSFAFDQFFPIIGPLGADLAGRSAPRPSSASASTPRGSRYAADDFRDPS